MQVPGSQPDAAACREPTSSPPGPRSDFMELGGLADALEGPDDPLPSEETGVAGWFRGLIPR